MSVGAESGLWVWIIIVTTLIGFVFGALTVVGLIFLAERCRDNDLSHLRDATQVRRDVRRVLSGPETP